MILLVALAAAVASVPLAGGRLVLLTRLRLRLLPLLCVGFLGQLLLLEVLASALPPGVARAVHVVTYLLVGAVVIANLGTPGIPLVALGGGLNLVAILANDGVMPASRAAFRAAGLAEQGTDFSNSVVVPRPRLALLGDVFHVPRPLPLANVFSIGDVLLVLGFLVLLHVACGSSWASRLRAARPGSRRRAAAVTTEQGP